MSTTLEGPTAVITSSGGTGLSANTPVKTRETATVVIPTLNVAPIIVRCLDALTWADVVYIVDMFSTDGTQEICRKYPNVRVFERTDYIYANVNYGMEQATTDWVIRLDSDEIISPELAADIVRVLENPEPEAKTYVFPSIQQMFGMPMHYGIGLPHLVARKCMFRRGTAHYECKAEHEDITASEPTKTLSGHYDHYTNFTTEEVVRKFNYYTERDVERLKPEELTAPRPARILYRSLRMFFLYYIQWKGYKDGYLGFFSCLFRSSVYMYLEEAKRWEAWEKAKKVAPSPGTKNV